MVSITHIQIQMALFFWSGRVVTQAAGRRKVSPESSGQFLDLVITSIRTQLFNPAEKVWRSHCPVRHIPFSPWFSCEPGEKAKWSTRYKNRSLYRTSMLYYRVHGVKGLSTFRKHHSTFLNICLSACTVMGPESRGYNVRWQKAYSELIGSNL